MPIKFSKEHGVNPAIPKCWWCLEDKNELILAGRLKDDAEAPKNMVWDMVPCDKCQDLMGQGIILISTRNGEDERLDKDMERARAEFERQHGWNKRKKFNYIPNPYRTGGWVVVTDDFINRVLDESVASQICQTRWSLVPDEAWEILGLPRGEQDGS